MYNLTNAVLAVSLDPQTGQIRSMIDRQTNRDYCQLDSTRFGMIGGLRVKDMLSLSGILTFAKGYLTGTSTVTFKYPSLSPRLMASTW